MKGKRFQLFAKKINNNESQISTAFIHFCMLKNVKFRTEAVHIFMVDF